MNMEEYKNDINMEHNYPNMKSTVNIQGEIVTQIIHFVGGIKRTYHGIISSSIKQGQFTKFKCVDGSMVMINDVNVLCIEVFTEK